MNAFNFKNEGLFCFKQSHNDAKFSKQNQTNVYRRNKNFTIQTLREGRLDLDNNTTGDYSVVFYDYLHS